MLRTLQLHRALPSLAALLLAAAPLLVSTRAEAQSSALIGTWAIEYAGGMRIENDMPTPIMVKATLTIAEVGDSLVATLKVDPNSPVGPRPDARFAIRKVPGNAATFVQTGQARMNANGEESTVTSISTWDLKADGAALSGTLARRLEGVDMPNAGPQPVTGKRM